MEIVKDDEKKKKADSFAPESKFEEPYPLNDMVVKLAKMKREEVKQLCQEISYKKENDVTFEDFRKFYANLKGE